MPNKRFAASKIFCSASFSGYIVDVSDDDGVSGKMGKPMTAAALINRLAIAAKDARGRIIGTVIGK